jgi:hypothetical protein
MVLRSSISLAGHVDPTFANCHLNFWIDIHLIAMGFFMLFSGGRNRGEGLWLRRWMVRWELTNAHWAPASGQCYLRRS